MRTTSATGRGWRGFVGVLVATVLVGAACGGGSSDSSTESATDAAAGTAPSETEPSVPGRVVLDAGGDGAAVTPFSLSAAQLAVVDESGPPDRFSIHFVEETGVDGSDVSIRHETWHHDDVGSTIVFRNGEVFTQERTGDPVDHPALGVTEHRPEQFVAGMTIDDLLAAAGLDGYYAVDEPALDGELLALDGLVAGVDGDGIVVYVEAVPINPAETPSSD